MPILQVFGILLAVGVILWAIVKYGPVEKNIKQIIVGLATILVILWLLSLFGVFDMFRGVYVGKPTNSGPVHQGK